MQTRTIAIIFLFFLQFAQAQKVPMQMENAERMRHLAILMERENRFDMAANYYIRALELDSRDMASYMGAKRCLLNLGNLEKLKELIFKLQKEKRDVQFSSDLAEIEYQRGHHDEALSKWNELLENHPKNHRVYQLVGNAYIEHRLFDLAITAFTKAREVFDSNQLFLFQLADIYTLREQYDRMSREYLAYLEANPNQYHFIESRFLNAATSQNAFSQIVHYLEDIKSQNTSMEIYQLLSSLYTQAQEYEKALNALIPVEDQLSKDKQSGRLLFDLARTASGNKEYEIARKAYETLIERYDSPFKIRAHFGLAEIYEHQGNFELAIDAFETFISQHSRSVEAIKAQMRIGDLWLEKKFDAQKAASAFESVLENYGQSALHAEAELKLANCFTLQGEFAKAEKIYHTVLNDNTKPQPSAKNQANFELGLLDFYRGRLQQAKDRFTQLIDAGRVPQIDDPVNDTLELLMLLNENVQDSVALVDYGKAKWNIRSRRYTKADSLLDSALAESTDMKENIWLLKSQIYEQTGQYARGIDVLQNILELNSALYADYALKRQADFNEKLGNFKEAMRLLEQFLEKYPSSIYIEAARRQIRTLRQII